MCVIRMLQIYRYHHMKYQDRYMRMYIYIYLYIHVCVFILYLNLISSLLVLKIQFPYHQSAKKSGLKLICHQTQTKTNSKSRKPKVDPGESKS